MNTAKAGRRREHKIRDLFGSKGYLVVRAAGSLGPIDLVAIPGKCPAHGFAGCNECPGFEMMVGTDPERQPPDQIVLVQVKPRPLWRAERLELSRLRKKLANTCRIEGWVLAFRKPAYRQFAY